MSDRTRRLQLPNCAAPSISACLTPPTPPKTKPGHTRIASSDGGDSRLSACYDRRRTGRQSMVQRSELFSIIRPHLKAGWTPALIKAVDDWLTGAGFPADGAAAPAIIAHRSEEHTSELQSLMRISYAVFCLKKKKTNSHS